MLRITIIIGTIIVLVRSIIILVWIVCQIFVSNAIGKWEFLQLYVQVSLYLAQVSLHFLQVSLYFLQVSWYIQQVSWYFITV